MKTCSICSHSKRLDIDRQIARGQSLTAVCRAFQVSRDALANHRDKHLSRQLSQAIRRQQALDSIDILGDLDGLIKRTRSILDMAEDRKKFNVALSALRELRGFYELLAKIAAYLHESQAAEREQEGIERDEELRQEQERQAAELLSKLSEIEQSLFSALNLRMMQGSPVFSNDATPDELIKAFTRLLPFDKQTQMEAYLRDIGGSAPKTATTIAPRTKTQDSQGKPPETQDKEPEVQQEGIQLGKMPKAKELFPRPNPHRIY